jgi:hypothetical protein
LRWISVSSGFVYEQLREKLMQRLTADELAGHVAQAGTEDDLGEEVRDAWR